ncbi:MAG: hypothetical protein JRH20_00735 [Deltaproteobacteria bacterium]|nr:hypothetical protein [Deltaproteobacteria bacterium]
MTSRVHEPPSLPLWLRLCLLSLAFGLRMGSWLLRLAWAATRTSLAGWLQISYMLRDAIAPLRRKLPGALRQASCALFQAGTSVLMGILRLMRGLLWPTTVLGATAGLALVLSQVDAPASPAQSHHKRGAQGANLTLDNPFEQERPTLTDSQLRRTRAALANADKNGHKKALREILAAQPADLPLLHRALLRRTKVSAANFKRVLRRIGAAVPDRHGRFSSPVKGKDAKKETDWLEALSVLDPASLPEKLVLARQEALYSVVLTRALVATGRSEAGSTILLFAYRHGEAFRDQCGRALRAMGSAAVPSLARAPLLKHPLTYRIARYASYQLDRLNRSRPELALANADPSLQVEMLHAYGEARTLAAVAAVVAHMDDSNGEVRRAARWAALRYVSGRPPRAAKRQLKLAGGKKTERARSLYLTYRQLARHELAARLATLEIKAGRAKGQVDAVAETLRREHDGIALAEKLSVATDERRAQAQRQRYEVALKLARTGRRKTAVAQLDRLLALQPEGSERGEIARIYLREGEAQLGLCAEGDRACHARAALALGKALALLAPNAASFRRAEAMRLIAEAGRDEGSGRRWRLERALMLDPGSELAQKRIDDLRHQHRSSMKVAMSAAGGTSLAALLLLVFWRRRRTP